MGRLNYYKMAAMPDKVYGNSIGSSYQQQGLTLSKQFKRDEEHLSGYAVGSTGETTNSPISVPRRNDTENDDDDEPSLLNLTYSEGMNEQLISAKGL